MKRILLLMMAGLIVFVSGALAHAPGNLGLTYYPGSQVLSVELNHTVDDKYKHFINKIDVQVNDDVVQSYYYHGQENSKLSLNEIKIKARDGDVINVVAYCNREGALEADLFLTEENAGEHSDDIEDFYRATSRRHFYRVLENYRYYRSRGHHDLIEEQEPLSEELRQPHNIQDNPRRRRIEAQEQLRKQVHEARFGTLPSETDQ